MSDRRDTPLEEPFFADDLDMRECDNPDCGNDHGPLTFSQQCHRAAGFDLVYHRGGMLEVKCMACDVTIVRLHIAHRRPVDSLDLFDQ